MPISLTTAQRYDKHTGMGTLFAAMLPYSLTFLGVFILQVIVWMTFDLPVGPGGLSGSLEPIVLLEGVVA